MSYLIVIGIVASIVTIAVGIFQVLHVMQTHPDPKEVWKILGITCGIAAFILVAAYVIPLVQVRISSSPPSTPTPQELYMQMTSGRTILNDPLNSKNANGWDTRSWTTGGCAFSGGAYHIYTSQQPFVVECYALATYFSNYHTFAFQVNMTIIKGDGGGGLILGHGGVNSKKYRFVVRPDGYYDLFIPQDPKILVDDVSSVINGLNQSNLLTVIVRGNSIYLYVNNKYIDQAHVADDTSISGEIGLFAVNGHHATEVVFRAAKVWMV